MNRGDCIRCLELLDRCITQHEVVLYRESIVNQWLMRYEECKNTRNPSISLIRTRLNEAKATRSTSRRFASQLDYDYVEHLRIQHRV